MINQVLLVPPTVPRRGGNLRRVFFVVVLVMSAAGIYAFVELGRYLTPEDALQKADAIFVLAGTRLDRPIEAADLYREGYAPTILLTRSESEQTARRAAEQRGVHIAREFELSRDVLLSMGVPADAVVSPDRIHDNTAEEAETLRQVAVAAGWRTVIVVSSKYHLRRVALACRRSLRGTGVRVIMRGSRYDPAAPDEWWRKRYDLRWVASELPKLLAYSIGAGT